MAQYKQYTGSPDIFTQEGKRITEQEAQTAGLFTPQGLSPQVEKISTPRPDITQESQFIPKAGTDILTTLPTPTIAKEDIPTSIKITDFGADISPLLAEQKRYREEYLKSLQPTAPEIDINKQISDIRTQAEQQRIQTQKDIYGMEGQGRGITTGLVIGQQEKLSRQAQLQQQTLASQEANLLSRLGLEQESRKAQQQVLQTGMGFIAQDIETQQKIQDRLQTEEDRVLTRADTLRDDARAILSTILTQFAGMDISDLTPEVQSQLAQTATRAGIPLDVLTAGMKSVKDQQDFSNALKMQAQQPKETSEIQEYRLAQDQGFRGSFLDYQKTKKSDVYKPPTSYQEWELAGKPGSYGDWLKEQNVKAPTIAQQTVAEYAARIEQSNPIIGSLEDTIKNMNLVSFEAQLELPPALQSKEMQQYMQAASNFINAKLRRESGAVISPSEFTEARSQYLPKPGDEPETLKQKKDTRDLIYASLRNAAGTAYQSVDELLGKSVELATLIPDIKNAIKDTARYQNREQLIDDIVNHYKISQEEASKKVYSIWTDNTKR